MTVARLVPVSAPDALDIAVDALRIGGIVAIPTETVYGLAVLPAPGPLDLLVAAKRRSADKGIALLVDGLDQVESLAAVPLAARRLASRFWPGPLTLVVPTKPGMAVPEVLTGGRPTLGFRLPDHAVPRALARRLGPIAASSANVSGQPDATDAVTVMATLADVVAVVLDDGPVRGGVPSTVVSVGPAVGDHPGEDGHVAESLVVLREGALSEADIRSAAD